MAAAAAAAIGSGIGSSVGGVVGGILNYYATRNANETNERIAKDNRDFQHIEALINRNWQENMANSAYQRSMADIDAAGLNPNLLSPAAAQVGSVSTPQGSTANMVAPKFDNYLNGITSAINAYNTSKLIDSMDSRNQADIILKASQDDLNRQLYELRANGAYKSGFIKDSDGNSSSYNKY